MSNYEFVYLYFKLIVKKGKNIIFIRKLAIKDGGI